MRFDEAPLLVIWETTLACDLACVHCRASAAPRRHSSELSTEEAYRLLKTVCEFGKSLMVFTGGDPLKRPDIFPLLGRSLELGLRTNISPSATPLLTKEAVQGFHKCGVARMAIGLDGPDAQTHDGSRGVPGTFDRAIEALEEAQRIGLETQIQTTVTRRNVGRLDEIAGLAAKTGTRMWRVFFLVVTGRALAGDDLAAEEYEQVFEKLYNISRIAPFDVKTTEAMHYRDLARRLRERSEQADPNRTVWRLAGVSDGRGFVFVSHTGEIYPSGFPPISAGNVRLDSLVDVYRNSPLFLELRDADGATATADFVSIASCAAIRAPVHMHSQGTTCSRPAMHLSAARGDRRSLSGELVMHDQLALDTIIRCILKPHHSLLRKEVARAVDLTGSVVVEQRPPLCRTLLPLYRLLQEFRCDLEDHLDAQDGRIFPYLLDAEVALSAGAEPVPFTDDISEGLRLLKYGQITLTSVLDEMRALTHGFIAPPDACECYGDLLDVLAAIQMEVAAEVRMEGSMLFPAATELMQQARYRQASTRELAGASQVLQ